MKTVKQLLRQPMKTLFGVVLIAIAVAVLCVCLGQSIAAKETEQRLNETFMTAAFAEADTDSLQSSWLSTYAAEHPEVVKSISYAGLASAYIPELTIDNWTQHWHKPLVQRFNMCAPYDTAILEITLTEIGEVSQRGTYAMAGDGIYILDENGELMWLDSPGDTVVVNLTGTVERVIALEEGYPDSTGFTARLTLTMPNQAALDALYLTVGERYLVYGTNYVDQDWELRHSVASIMSWYDENALPQWALDTLEVYRNCHSYEYEGITYYYYDVLDEEGNRTEHITTTDLEEVPIAGYKCRLGDLYHGMTPGEYNQFRSITMSLKDDGIAIWTQIFQPEDGTWVDELIDVRSYIDENGQEILISQEEYAQRYREPVIAHLTGTAEEFLASEEGVLWAEALHNVEVNNHAFAVIGVDKLRYLENFNSGEAKMVQGRDFTDEELEAGAMVCVISKQLAEANGLTVGDTIEPQFYDPDRSLEYQLQMSDNTFTPKPHYYFSNTTALQEARSYTIVGIYEQNDPTPSLLDSYGKMLNPYGFTSNTIFAPKASIDAVMQYSESWMFKTVVIHNGALEEFQLAAIEAGLGEEFRYDDNGYAAVEQILPGYQEGANRAMMIGLVVYGIVLLLYLVLYPAREGAVVATMESLGASRIRRMGHILGSSLGVLLPGTLLGVGAGMLLWQRVVDMLAAGGSSILGIQMDISAMAAIAGGQLGLAVVLVFLLSLPMAGSRSLMKRK